MIFVPFFTFGILGWYTPIRGSILEDPIFWIGILFLVVLAESLVFWTGILMVYGTSVQLGVNARILGAIFGWAPIASIFMLGKILRITTREVKFEKEKIKVNEKREEEQICRTRYPILMVHGVFFRDFTHFNYWGRIPGELEKNGASIYYGNHNKDIDFHGMTTEEIEASSDNGGLNVMSKWYQNAAYKALLTGSFAKDAGTDYKISAEKAKELKQKIESNGIGNSKSSNALTDIYNSLK